MTKLKLIKSDYIIFNFVSDVWTIIMLFFILFTKIQIIAQYHVQKHKSPQEKGDSVNR